MRKWIVLGAAMLFLASCSLTEQDSVNGAASKGKDRYKDIVVTQNLTGKKPQTFSSYLAQRAKISARAANAPLVYREINFAGATKKLSLIVNANLYPSISDNIERYAADLGQDGYNVILRTVDPTITIETIKNYLKTDYQSQGIDSAFLVGTLPTAWFELTNVWWSQYEEFPCDYYLMDLDGTWVDSDNNGKFDKHSGTYQAEVMVGRITADKITSAKTETELINNYFNKNHAYRAGTLRLSDKAYSIINSDWQYTGFDNEVSMAYPNNTVLKSPVEAVTADAYRDAIKGSANNRYESIFIASHSWWGGHTFYTGTFYSTEIEPLPVQAHFYNLFACSGARYTEQDSLVEWYIMQSQYGLNAVGSSKTGGMLTDSYFYTPLGLGETVGKAYLDWYKNVVTLSDSDQSWFYGMIMFGDPALKISRYQGIVSSSSSVILSSSSSVKSSSSSVISSISSKVSSSSISSSSSLHQIPGTIEAEDYSGMYGVQTESCSEGGLNVGWIDIGDWMDYSVNVTQTGTFELEYRVASQYSSGAIDFIVDGLRIASTSIPNTGGWQNWTTVKTTVSLNMGTGRKNIRLYASGALFNINKFSVKPSGSSSSSSIISSVSSVSSKSSVSSAVSSSSSFSKSSVTSTGAIKVQIYNEGRGQYNNTIYPRIRIVNTGSTSVNLANVKVRYYYTADGSAGQNVAIDYASGQLEGGFAVITTMTTGVAARMSVVKTGADSYAEISFNTGAGILATQNSVDVQARIYKTDWSNFDQFNDYSFNANSTTYIDWTKTTGYVNGINVWGVEP